MRITVFMALSLDGFFADESGGVDWLNNLDVQHEADEDYGYGALIDSVDRLLMGRKSLEEVLSFDR